MIFASVLAAGSGSRMNSKIGKQYIELSGKPIFIYSLETLVKSNYFDEIIIAVPEKDISFVEKEIKKYIKAKISVIAGGNSRNDTLTKIIEYIYSNNKISSSDIILTHDAARPFIDNDIIADNLEKAKIFSGATAGIGSTDTIAITDKSKIIDVPKRDYCYNVQTPQSFNLKKLKKYIDELTDSQKADLTDASKIFLINDETVVVSKGSQNNLKITYPNDLKIAENILKNINKNK
ncbi:MAG: IspD/TarI family cytidylyltransferase [Clostridia bacterium]|nr:IspD/TarI family cytidylyltransferase [Clostridia bacterium]